MTDDAMEETGEAACDRQLFLDCLPPAETDGPEEPPARRARPHPLVLLFLTAKAIAALIFFFLVAVTLIAGAAMLAAAIGEIF